LIVRFDAIPAGILVLYCGLFFNLLATGVVNFDRFYRTSELFQITFENCKYFVVTCVMASLLKSFAYSYDISTKLNGCMFFLAGAVVIIYVYSWSRKIANELASMSENQDALSCIKNTISKLIIAVMFLRTLSLAFGYLDTTEASLWASFKLSPIISWSSFILIADACFVRILNYFLFLGMFVSIMVAGVCCFCFSMKHILQGPILGGTFHRVLSGFD
jgi:hypothetical protein